MTPEEFYRECARILGVEYDASPIDKPRWSYSLNMEKTTSRNRWVGRDPGNGRYPGFGLIRMYGECVHVALTHPVSASKVFNTPTKALEFLRTIMLDTNRTVV